MNDKPVEILVFEFLQEQVDAASSGAVLSEIDVHDTVYQAMKKDRPRVIRVSDAVSDFAPIGAGELKEFDVALQIVAAVKVEGKDQKARGPALQSVFEIEKAVIGAIVADFTLGDRICDCVVEKSVRGYDSLDGNPYAVANISLLINPSGEQ